MTQTRTNRAEPLPPLAIRAWLRYDVVKGVIDRLRPRTALEIGSEQAAVEYEDRQQILAMHGAAPPEAIAAFLEKRPARFAD